MDLVVIGLGYVGLPLVLLFVAPLVEVGSQTSFHEGAVADGMLSRPRGMRLFSPFGPRKDAAQSMTPTFW